MQSQWSEYKKILHVIDRYYPKECEFASKYYTEAREYKRYKRVINNSHVFKQKENEYFHLISAIFPEYYIKRWTNTTYPCYQFSVLLKKNQPILDDDIELMDALGGKRYNLEIFISRISNYYYVYTSEVLYSRKQNKNWEFYSHSATYRLEEKFIRQLQKEMGNRGMKRISKKMAHIKVPFIETELLPGREHEIELFNCLFSDMIIDYY